MKVRNKIPFQKISKFMLKRNTLILLLILMIIHFSCKKTYDLSGKWIAINEVMPVNLTVVADQNGEYDDWIELFNLSSVTIDISGYYLSDNKHNPWKWQLPKGTSIPGKGYLVVWTDKDTTQAGLHANFKLSSLGENLVLSLPDGTIIDKVEYPAQTLEVSYSRNPDGTGDFIWQNPTFNKTNNNP
jgi:hypothetical protein